jgi:hypothetical protein
MSSLNQCDFFIMWGTQGTIPASNKKKIMGGVTNQAPNYLHTGTKILISFYYFIVM